MLKIAFEICTSHDLTTNHNPNKFLYENNSQLIMLTVLSNTLENLLIETSPLILQYSSLSAYLC